MHEVDDVQMSSTCRSMWNGTRQLPPSPVTDRGGSLVDANNHAVDDASVLIIERDGVAALELPRSPI